MKAKAIINFAEALQALRCRRKVTELPEKR